MATRYLLPCPKCEQKTSITISQAGETLTCSECQSEMTVPSMSGIKELAADAQVEPRKPKRGREWNESQGLWFSLGIICVLVGVSGVGGFLFTYNRLNVEEKYADINQEEFEEVVDQWTVAESWEYWSKGVEGQPLPEWSESELSVSRRYRKAMLFLAAISGVIAVFGVGSFAYSFVGSKKKKPVRKKKRPAA